MYIEPASFVRFYDVLPSLTNLSQWYGRESTYPLWPSSASLRHILSGCKTSLSYDRYTWQHDHLLKCLVSCLEAKMTSINALPAPPQKPQSLLIRSGPHRTSRSVSWSTGLEDTHDHHTFRDLGGCCRRALCALKISELNSTNGGPRFIQSKLGLREDQQQWRWQIKLCGRPLSPSPTPQSHSVAGSGGREEAAHGQRSSSSSSSWESREFSAKGGTSGTPGVANQLSGGVMGYTWKHRGRGVPTWWRPWCLKPPALRWAHPSSNSVEWKPSSLYNIRPF